MKKPKPAAETGAPAALARVAREELEASEARDEARRAIQMNAEEGEFLRQKREYECADDRWYRAVRALRDLDRSVVPERRSEEMVPRAEVAEICAQVLLCVALAGEAALLAAAQDAAISASEEEFYSKAAPRVRGALKDALASATSSDSPVVCLGVSGVFISRTAHKHRGWTQTALAAQFAGIPYSAWRDAPGRPMSLLSALSGQRWPSD